MQNIFVSRPNWIPKEFNNGLESFYNLLKAHNLQPRTIGQTDFPTKSPLDEVIDLLTQCEGTIVLGIPQIALNSGLIKGEKIESSIELGTEWNHIEAALTHSLNLPLLVLHHKTVIRGIFDRGASNSFLHKVDMTEPNWATSDGISGAISNWKSKLKAPQEKELINNTSHLEKPKLKWGAYKFENEEGLFCPVCYQKDSLKIPVSRFRNSYFQCPNCQAKLR